MVALNDSFVHNLLKTRMKTYKTSFPTCLNQY